MILLDDAGSGSLIGGTIIGAMRAETNEYFFDIIPLKYYSPELFKKKIYLDQVVEITKNLFENLNVSKEEKVLICRGYMFDNLRYWLKDNNFMYQNVKIDEPLQSQVERSFEEYTIDLGFPRRFIKYTKYPFHFHRILRWVYADYDNRVNLCKTGWKSWEKYGNLDVKISYTTIKQSKYICLKCNKRINDNSSVKVIKFISNRPQKIFLHANC